MNTTLATPNMTWRLESISSHLLDIAFDKNSTASQLFLIVAVFAVVWFIVFYILKSIIRPFVHNKPWLLEGLERHYERTAKKQFAELKINMTKEECIAWSMNDWPRMQCILLQHLAGSLLCIPSLFGIGDPSVASSLAICGVLSEIGWELQDMIEILFVRAFFKNGKAIWPDAIVIVFLVHHSLSTILGLPMILYYRSNRSLHWLCFDLQFAAAMALWVGEYTKLMDITNPSKLRQFKVLNFIACVTMLWTRVIHWTYLCFDLYITWWQDEAYTFLSIGILVSIGFTAFSYIACVKPFCRNFVKFLHVSEIYEKLPTNAAPEKRRSSVVQLDQAMADLLEGDGMMELTDVVGNLFERRQPSIRRKSVPMHSRKRMSLVFAHSKSFGHEAFHDTKKYL